MEIVPATSLLHGTMLVPFRFPAPMTDVLGSTWCGRPKDQKNDRETLPYFHGVAV